MDVGFSEKLVCLVKIIAAARRRRFMWFQKSKYFFKM
jgi:hypothetical protein